MADVQVLFDDNQTENAVLLLAAAEELGLGAGAVRTVEGAFLVPEEVRDKAFEKPEEKPAPAKKTTAKKTAKK